MRDRVHTENISAPTEDGSEAKRRFGSGAGMRAFAAMMGIFPRRLVYAVAAVVVFWYVAVRGAGRRASGAYQRRLGQSAGRLKEFSFAYAQALAFSRVILDNVYLGLFGPNCFAIEEIGIDGLREAIEAKKGLIMLSAHVGNWHLAVNFLGETGVRVHVVTDEARHEEVRRQMDRAKLDSRHLTMHDAAAGPDLIFALRAALKAGEIVVLAGDRTAPGASAEKTRDVPFLGAPARFPATAFLLASATGAPVCCAFAFRTGVQRYDFHAVGPIEVVRRPGDPPGRAGREAAVGRAMGRYVSQLEGFVRRYPHQWFNFFDFWKKT